MAANFAALEARLNAAVIERLSNRQAMLGGILVSGIFDNGYQAAALAGAGLAGSNPTWLIATRDVPAALYTALQNYPTAADPLNLMIQFDESGPVYRIVGQEPDGTGMTLLQLRT